MSYHLHLHTSRKGFVRNVNEFSGANPAQGLAVRESNAISYEKVGKATKTHARMNFK